MLFFIVNAGSTSSKLAIYQDDKPLATETIVHSAGELKPFSSVWDQYEFRKKTFLDWLEKQGRQPADFDAFVARGGIFNPMASGEYPITQELIDEARYGQFGNHAAGLGCMVALALSREMGRPAITVDPPSCDEFIEEAKITGLPRFRRWSWYHALNQKASARKVAGILGRAYEDLNIIVTHMGGGITTGAHRKGRVIDTNNAIDGDGPFTPERVGALPTEHLVGLCFSGEFTQAQIRKMLVGNGGLYAHLGTTDAREVEARIEKGDAQAKLVYDAMIYQVSKSIGAAAVSLKGQVDAVVLTGGVARSKYVASGIRDWAGWVGPFHIFPGEMEMEALALGALRYLVRNK